MPKALSPLQSDQRSYTSKFSVGELLSSCGIKRVLSWRLSELVSKESTEGNLEFAGYQGCSGYDGCGIVVIYSVVNCKTEGVRRDSVVLYLSVRL
jgi:hypothetical protein